MSPLHPHFTITIIKAYFSSSSFNPVHHVCLTKTKLQGIMKGKKTVWRTQQASEPDPFMTGMLELTDWELITTMIETVGWCHWFSGHKSEQTSGDSEGQGSLVCYSPWGCKELDMTLSNWTTTATMIRMLKALTDKVDTMSEQKSNASKVTEILRKSKKEMLDIKTPL